MKKLCVTSWICLQNPLQIPQWLALEHEGSWCAASRPSSLSYHNETLKSLHMQHLHLKSWVCMYGCQLEHKNPAFLKQEKQGNFLAATERSKGLQISKYLSQQSLTCQPVRSSSGAARQVMHTKLPWCLGPWICKLGLMGVLLFHSLTTEKQITRRQQLIPTSHRLGADGTDRDFQRNDAKIAG